jgi:hypothetical protein
MNIDKPYMTPEKLFAILPEGHFYISQTIDAIREYSPFQRFPRPKFALWEIYDAWYQLMTTNRLNTDDGITAKKVS